MEEIKGIKCELYSIIRKDNSLVPEKRWLCFIHKKSLFLSSPDDVNTSSDEVSKKYDEYLFDYSFSLPYRKKITINQKVRKLNTIVSYEVIQRDVLPGAPPTIKFIYYTSLTVFQRLNLSFNFRRLWIQQSSNIMWLINILIAILAVYATFLLVNDGGSIRIIFN